MVSVRYYCPRCETIVAIDRAPELADKSVTPYPLEGWTYVDVGGDYDAADGIRIVCGEDGEGDEGCGEPFYLNFVRFEDGVEVEPDRPAEHVRLAGEGPARPRTPDWPGA